MRLNAINNFKRKRLDAGARLFAILFFAHWRACATVHRILHSDVDLWTHAHTLRQRAAFVMFLFLRVYVPMPLVKAHRRYAHATAEHSAENKL